MDEMIKSIDSISYQYQKEMIDGLEAYEKSYSS